MPEAFHPTPIPPYPEFEYPKVSANMNFSQCPEIARNYARLSPDADCQRHLDIWLEDNGSSLDSFYRWIQCRLNSDNWELPEVQWYALDDFSWLDEIDNPTDWSMLDNLNCLG
jgi:hypothetical protein